MKRETILTIMGGSILLAFYGLLFTKLFQGGNVELEIGALISGVSLILGYYFGSSQGSKDKDKGV